MPKRNTVKIEAVVAQAIRIWHGYQDYWKDYQTKGERFCLPPSLVEALEKLGEAIGDETKRVEMVPADRPTTEAVPAVPPSP